MKKTLIVIDMQNDFIDGSLGTDEAVKIGLMYAKRLKNTVQTVMKLFLQGILTVKIT